MTTTRLTRALAMAGLLVLAACGSPPKPVHPDGTARVPVNDQARLERMRQQTAAEQSLVVERQAMKDELVLLRTQLETLRRALQAIVVEPQTADAIRSTYPAAVSKPAPGPAPIAPASTPPAAPDEKRSQGPEPAPIAADDEASHAVASSGNATMFRVFHDDGKTEFQPSPEIERQLLAAARDAKQIVIWGRTDSWHQSETSKELALARARAARAWLIANGVDDSLIRIRYSSAGYFLGDNRSDEGRALNRRVDIETRGSVVATTSPTNG